METKIGIPQIRPEKDDLGDTLELRPKLTDTASCFIDTRDEEQIAELLEDVAEPPVTIESEAPPDGDPTEKIIISKSERDVLDSQILDFMAESKRLHEELEETRRERDFLFDKLRDAQKEIMQLREMVDELVRRLAMGGSCG